MESENVKERLNTLLHKKLIEQERENKDVQQSQPPEEAMSIKQEIDCEKNSTDCETEATTESPRTTTGNLECDLRENLTENILLHDILNEKKKALLRDKDVMQFFQNKLK